MDLTFNKDGGSFVAEFVATADFNLHIEKSGGDIRIMQKTTENGKYDSIDGLYIPAGNPVIDYDFVGAVYPKYIKIVSEVEPTMAEVTETSDTSGGQGGITIDNQDKVVEITENGTIELTADEGYTGLGKVQINTNVAGGDTSAPEYIGFRLYSAVAFGDGYEYEFSVMNNTGTWQDAVYDDRLLLYYKFSEQDDNVYVTIDDNSYMIYKTMEGGGWNVSYSDPVKVTDKLESRTYYIETTQEGGIGGGGGE